VILLDENVPEGQRRLLQSWRIHVRQLGSDLEHQGLRDEQIIVLLRRLRRVTFFTLDSDFYKPNLCHANYCVPGVSIATRRKNWRGRLRHDVEVAAVADLALEGYPTWWCEAGGASRHAHPRGGGAGAGRLRVKASARPGRHGG
jgi:hypothetical protein